MIPLAKQLEEKKKKSKGTEGLSNIINTRPN